MGLIYGSGSFTRFLVDGALPEHFMEEISIMISRYTFQNLDEDSEHDRSTGWVNILDMFDNTFAGMEYLKEPCIAMSWRVDVRKVPSKALIQYCRDTENKIKETEKLEYLSKKHRQKIREEVKIKLLKRAIPQTNTYDIIWNIHTGVLIFGSTNNKLCDEFAEFFFNCFGLHLKAIFPYSIALQVLEGEGMEPEFLENIRSSIFVEVH
ncbi:MAG: recombination-associated protein RdgC [Thermodesulfobacteriota bacterium]|nr:recombination-associated protein RdgC [Thermodesulfobacteriota bacterium]